MHNYTEFDKLVKMLDDAKIPYERLDEDPDHDFYKRTNRAPIKRIHYGKSPEKPGLYFACSVICGYGTYGGDAGLLEIMGLLTPEEEELDSVAGYLTAEDVFNRIKNHYDSNDVVSDKPERVFIDKDDEYPYLKEAKNGL